jgi:hypothetical protein
MQDSSLANDSSVISEIWEASLQSALRSLKRAVRLRPVRDLDAYVFGLFQHRLKKPSGECGGLSGMATIVEGPRSSGLTN